MGNEAANINLPESYTMVGGDGDHSYAKNSSYQILGCSVGPNTLIAVQNIIEAVELKYHQNPSALEFQVFFNDHIDNDFNTLFTTLPTSRKYFAAGVPGSFHGRLFPKSTLHFVHSFNAVHWLLKIPKEIVDSKSAAWNKGSIQCTGLVKEVSEAYSTQFKNDMESFLNARAQELVPGGLMAIVLSGLPNGVHISETTDGKLYDFLGSCLADMAKTVTAENITKDKSKAGQQQSKSEAEEQHKDLTEAKIRKTPSVFEESFLNLSRRGLLNEEKVDSFNLPLYFPTSKELQDIIEINGCFTIEILDILRNPLRNMKFHPQSGIRQLRAVLEGVIKAHFGNEFVDQIFNHIATKFPVNLFAFKGIKQHSKVILFFLLKRITD
ncbi:S-adenosylmethionine-dependent methyltransferase [Melia azedarach]|uniref:S-adenosylmethionine-dependent methyltransferase n=1 Tax=Melia azedarach TaxID=155640 RepID=A0ACC1X7C3_MELAZ|nr:S-adenosylmethionine-dependent methyltransferase [Melia azedarach]